MNQGLNLLIAFGGGILAFFSPCFLPLVPAYLIYITGLSFEEIKHVRIKTIIHSLLFIAGFTVVFTILGLAAGLIGEFLFTFGSIIRIIGGGLVIFLGLYLAGVVKLPILDIDKKLTIAGKPSGLFGTFLVGMVFALGWSPCVGPILAGILLVASQTESAGVGMLMLIAFSLGLGLPLLLVSIAVNFSLSLLKRVQQYLPAVHFISGVFLVIVGILLITNYLQTISVWLIELTGYQGI